MAIPGGREAELVYKREWRKGIKARGYCYNHVNNPIVEGTAHCQQCLDYKKESYRKIKNSGRCVGHPGRQALPGKNRCAECVETAFSTALRKRYGLTVSVYQEMKERQGNACSICRDPFSGKVFVDHDHATGNVRALLCPTCNAGLGQFYDSPNLLKAAASYIETFNFSAMNRN